MIQYTRCNACGETMDSSWVEACAFCASENLQLIQEEEDSDFDSYEEAIEYDECDMQGHDWIDNSAGECVCQRCGASGGFVE